MKILLFIDSLGGGGAQRQLVGLAKMLKERDYDVKVAVYHDLPYYLPLLEASKIPVRLVYGSAAKRICSFYKLTKSYKPDWVISYLESPSLIACIVKLLTRYKLIVSERNTSQIFDRTTHIRFEFFRLADYVVPNAYSQEKFIAINAPYLKHKTLTINNFVDTELFRPGPKYGNRNHIQEIVVAASIWKPKNTLKFIEAIGLLVKKYKRFHVSWYGKVPEHHEYVSECLALIDSMGVSNYISLNDKTQNIREIYQVADLFCLPSFYEGTPNVIGEAMSCGLPIVCSDVCDNSIYVESGENGFLFNPKSSLDMSEKLYQALMLTDMAYQNMCKSSYNKAIKLFSAKKFIDRYLTIIENL